MSDEDKGANQVIILGRIPVLLDILDYIDKKGSQELNSEAPSIQMNAVRENVGDVFSEDDGRREEQRRFKQKPFRRPPHEFSDHRRQRR